jgi:hypothetical protein
MFQNTLSVPPFSVSRYEVKLQCVCESFGTKNSLSHLGWEQVERKQVVVAAGKYECVLFSVGRVNHGGYRSPPTPPRPKGLSPFLKLV